MKATVICMAAVVGFGSAIPTMAALAVPDGLTGTATYDAWDFLTVPTHSDWKAGAWTPIQSNEGTGAGSAEFTKTSGAAYPFQGLIYVSYLFDSQNPGASHGSTFSVTADAAGNVESVVLQMMTGDGIGGSVNAAPTLTLNGGGTALAAAYSENVSTGPVSTPVGEMDGTVWLWQWNLQGEGSIDSFAIDWSAFEHSQIYSMRLDQSDEFSSVSISPSSVPEPGSLALLSLAGLALLRRRR